MKSRNIIPFLIAICFSAIGCEKVSQSHQKGEVTLYTDESFKSVSEALADGYSIAYPDTKIKVETKKEDLGLVDLLNGKAKLIVMSRDLSSEELEIYKERVDDKFIPARFAADAVVFVVPKNSSLASISYQDIIKGLQSDDKSFIFDGTNSSNLNFVAQKLNKHPKDLKFSIISGSNNLIEELDKYPNKIGVIGLNTISREYDSKSKELRDKVKILPVENQGTLYSPTTENLKEMKYPFTRIMYFLTNERGFNLANGFIRYSCTQLGQLIVDKEGLQPYNLYNREVIMR